PDVAASDDEDVRYLGCHPNSLSLSAVSGAGL
ncbi:MAG: hypothetical protein QOG10_5975, partial [Kribbellaceae bacterium]|nr:hypothetical protein [Kribbellaceae bacterium]